jgi:hypothetical protein
LLVFSEVPSLPSVGRRDRALSLLPWVVSRGRSYVFFWADPIIRKDNPIPAYSQVSIEGASGLLLKSNGREECKHRCSTLVDPTHRRTKIIETCQEDGCAVSTQETDALRKLEMEHLTR